MASDRPEVSAIIVNWNGAHHLKVCLPSLLAQSFKHLEIIVVDNGSKDDSEEVTREYHARWLPLERNEGLAPGLNRGAAISHGDFLLFINNDMRFDPEFVATLVEPLKQDGEIFATDGMQYNWDGTQRGHMAARLTKKRGKAKPSQPTPMVPGLYFYQREEAEKSAVFMGSAACMLARRSLFEKMGGFDNDLPLGYEDAEICWRAWVYGWRTVYVPQAVCWHRIGSSGHSPEGERMNFRGIVRGRLLLATKLLPMRYALLTWLASVAALSKDVLRLKFESARDRIEVLAQTAVLVPRLIRDRDELFEKAARSPEEQLNFLLGLGTEQARF